MQETVKQARNYDSSTPGVSGKLSCRKKEKGWYMAAAHSYPCHVKSVLGSGVTLRSLS